MDGRISSGSGEASSVELARVSCSPQAASIQHSAGDAAQSEAPKMQCVVCVCLGREVHVYVLVPVWPWHKYDTSTG